MNNEMKNQLRNIVKAKNEIIEDREVQIHEVDVLLRKLGEEWGQCKAGMQKPTPTWEQVNQIRDIAGWLNEALVNVQEFDFELNLFG